MANEPELPNVFRTDVKVYALISGKQYPVSLVETMFRLDEIPFAYVEIPMGRKAPAVPTTSAQDLPGAGSLVADVQPLTPFEIHVQCTSYGELPQDPVTKQPKLRGYVDGEYMTIFRGYVLSPWVRKRRGGSATLAITAMGEIGLLAASTNYTSTITPVDSTKKINLPFGAGAKLVSNLTEWLWNINTGAAQKGPAPNITSAILQLFTEIAKQSTPMGLPSAANGQAIPAIERLIPASGTGGLAEAFPVNTNENAPMATPLATGAQSTTLGVSSSLVFDIDYNKMLNWSVARHIADLLYAGWANGIGDGGGDLWITLNLLAKSFMFSVLPTARVADFIIPIFYGAKGDPFRVIDPNEYWAVETGKSFNPRDYSYVGAVSLWTPRAPIPTLDAQGAKTVIEMPSLGYYGMTPPGSNTPTGRLQTVECPTWAIPPVDLSTDWLGDNKKPPDAGSADDPTYSPARPATEFWYNYVLGSRVAQWLQGHLAYAHRVMAITGRLRFDIAPGSLVQINTADDIFSQNENAKMYSLFGHVAEVRTIIGTRGKRTTAQTVITLGHVHNETERKAWQVPSHPVFGLPWVGTHLVEGCGS